MMNSAESRRELFLKGAGSYLGATVALQAFDKEVQDICRDAYTRNAPALTSQMGLDSAEPEPYKYDEDAGEDGVELGIRRPAQKGGCSFYIYLQWIPAESDQPDVRAVIWLDLKGKRSRDELHARLLAKSRACKVVAKEGAFWGLELTAPLPPEGLADANAILDKLASEWCADCKSIGGLKLDRR